MRPRFLFVAGVLAWASFAGTVEATTFRVDDSATIPHESSATLRWRQIAPSRGGDNTIEGSTTVQVRLNLAPWLNRSGRVFLVLPEQPIGPVRVSWTTALPPALSPTTGVTETMRRSSVSTKSCPSAWGAVTAIGSPGGVAGGQEGSAAAAVCAPVARASAAASAAQQA